MTPLWGNLAGAITVLLLIVFVGIWCWAWRARHGRIFERMARLPMEDGGVTLGNDEDDRR